MWLWRWESTFYPGIFSFLSMSFMWSNEQLLNFASDTEILAVTVERKGWGSTFHLLSDFN